LVPLGVQPPPDNRPPLAAALEWVSQITAIAVEIVGCIWLGRWLDGWLGSSHWTVVGLIVGPMVGFYHLLTVTGVLKGKIKRDDEDDRGSD
jgi:hypothetical protein